MPLDGLYVQAGLGWQAQHGACIGNDGKPGICAYDRNVIRNPLGHIELGYEDGTSRVRFAVFVRHESQTAVHDYGVNQAGVSVRFILVPR